MTAPAPGASPEERARELVDRYANALRDCPGIAASLELQIGYAIRAALTATPPVRERDRDAEREWLQDQHFSSLGPDDWIEAVLERYAPDPIPPEREEAIRRDEREKVAGELRAMPSPDDGTVGWDVDRIHRAALADMVLALAPRASAGEREGEG
jgi:hypothetical protein